MAEAVANDYRLVLAAAHEAARTDETSRKRTLLRLQRELQRINRRDYFPPPERDAARQAVRSLGSAVEAVS
jgi:hypothetical protein